MALKLPIIPKFLNKLDRYLLLHMPVVWTTRVHLVAWFSLLFSITLTILCITVPTNPLADSSSFVWTTLTGALSFLGFITWVIYLLRFNVFKRHGNNGKLDALKNFVLFFAVAACFAAPTYIPTAIESARANSAFSNEEIVNDINEINIKINQLEYDSLNHSWRKESIIVKQNNETRNSTKQYSANSNDDIYNYIYDFELQDKLLNADSVVRINDSMYQFFICPVYSFLEKQPSDLYTKTKEKSNHAIYKEIIKNFNRRNKLDVEKELDLLLKKYSYSNTTYNYNEQDLYTSTDKEAYYSTVQKRYNLYSVCNGLNNLINKKYRWYTDNETRVRIWFYLSFILALFTFIFRHSTTKAFFLSILTCIILFVLTTILIAFLHLSQKETVYIFCLVYYSLFFIITLIGIGKPSRNILTGITLNIITFFTFLIPIIVIQLYYEKLNKLYQPLSNYPSNYLETKSNTELIAEIGGILLFLILLQPFFKRFYRTWFAKPEE